MTYPLITTPGLAGASAPHKPRQAVILSGGGANGAYEVGVLKALFSDRCKGVPAFDPEFFFGTSIGSYSAAFLVSQWEEYGTAAVANLERAWLDVLAGDVTRNGAFRFRGDPGYFLNPLTYLPNPLQPALALARDSAYLTWEGIQRAVYLVSGQEGRRDDSVRDKIANLFDFSLFISTEPWQRTIRETINFADIRRSGQTRKLRIFATNWATGRVETFRNHQMTDTLGPLAVEASSAIPGILPEVYVGAEPYVDGAVLMNTPLRPALDEGVDVIHVVYLDPDVAAIPLSALNSTVAASYRMQTIAWAALVNREIARARRINRGLEVFGRLQRGEALGNADLERLAKGAVIVLGAHHVESYRPITIHRYHPQEELGGGALGLLNLNRDHIQNLIEKGFVDATLHNCRQECCVIAGEDFPECEDER